MHVHSPHADLHRRENCAVAYQLNWSYSVFWNGPQAACTWFPELQHACEQDEIRLLEHEFKPPNVSQFLVSTKPSAPPALVSWMLSRGITGELSSLVYE